jgi:putative acetyltransferase
MNGGPDELSEIRDGPFPLQAPRHGAASDGVAGRHVLRRYEERDEASAMALWLRTWSTAYPSLDFAARLAWWRERWRKELVPAATIVVAEAAGTLIGFVTVDRRTLYLDQIVVAPQYWGAGLGKSLIAEAKRLSPAGLDLDVNVDNYRAIRFYEGQAFRITGSGINPHSGKPVHRMSWRP